MAFLVRCPSYLCKRPKRIDGERAANGAFPTSQCPDCWVTFYAVPPGASAPGSPPMAFPDWP